MGRLLGETRNWHWRMCHAKIQSTSTVLLTLPSPDDTRGSGQALQEKSTEGPFGEPAACRTGRMGSKAFLKRMVKLAKQQDPTKQGPLTRRARAYSVGEIMELVAELHQVDSLEYVGFRSSAPGRDMAALVCRRFTSSTLAELSVAFGLGHPDSAANLVRRAARESESQTENQV